MKYVLMQFYPVEVTFTVVHDNVPQLVTAMSGVESGQRCEHIHKTIWPNDRFQRDDIDDANVQRGYVSHVVGQIVRRYFLSDDITLMNYKGRVRVCSSADADGFFTGFARNLRQAATWVATGKAKIVVPWGGA